MADLDVRIEYRIRRTIDAKMDEGIIEDARSLIEQDKNAIRNLKRSQFANLLGVTQETTSVQVILTWVRYQIGRQAAWREGELGIGILRQLEGLKPIAVDILGEAYEGIPAPPERDLKRKLNEIWLTLIRQYVGQLQRIAYPYQRD